MSLQPCDKDTQQRQPVPSYPSSNTWNAWWHLNATSDWLIGFRFIISKNGVDLCGIVLKFTLNQDNSVFIQIWMTFAFKLKEKIYSVIFALATDRKTKINLESSKPPIGQTQSDFRKSYRKSVYSELCISEIEHGSIINAYTWYQ